MIEQLKSRFWALVMPILIGIFVIIYAAMGLFYFQQQRKQSDLKTQIDQLNAIVSQPVELSPGEQADYEAAQQAIPTGLVDEDDIREFQEEVIGNILEIAGADFNRISIEPKQNELFREEKVGNSTYQVLLFEMDIEGDYDKIVAFISTLDSIDSMPDLKTLVPEKLDIKIGEPAGATLVFGIYTLE